MNYYNIAFWFSCIVIAVFSFIMGIYYPTKTEIVEMNIDKCIGIGEQGCEPECDCSMNPKFLLNITQNLTGPVFSEMNLSLNHFNENFNENITFNGWSGTIEFKNMTCIETTCKCFREMGCLSYCLSCEAKR